MRGIILSYRRGRHTMRGNQAIIKVDERPEALIGKKVVWTSPGGKKIKGVITARHGSGYKVRARFERGLPGQAIGTPVEIL